MPGALLALDKAEQITTANQVAARKLSVREAEALVQKVAASGRRHAAPKPAEWRPNRRCAARGGGAVDLLMAQVEVRLKKSGKQHTGGWPLHLARWRR